MGVTQKDYDYDEVVKFTQSGGDLDQALTSLQDNLSKLYDKIKECEPLYHGNGSSSSIYTCYQNLYDKLGTMDKQGTMWFNANICRQLIDMMYDNAKRNQDNDASY